MRWGRVCMRIKPFHLRHLLWLSSSCLTKRGSQSKLRHRYPRETAGAKERERERGKRGEERDRERESEGERERERERERVKQAHKSLHGKPVAVSDKLCG